MSVPPVVREVDVQADQATAFRVFTDRIGVWWPLARLSVHGAGSRVAFADGQLVETSASGEVAVWGTVEEWSPPAALAFSWHPGGDPSKASRVRVTFAAAGSTTRVRLVHDGWDVLDDPAGTRAEYERGWPGVLSAFGSAAETDDGAETWVALFHEPVLGVTGPVFSDARFGDHLSFLRWMRRCGYLVAAGPFADADGSGMTILRLPGADGLAEATSLATERDAAVTGGLLTVTVRPWRVVLSERH